MVYKWWEEHAERWGDELRRLQNCDFFRFGEWRPLDESGSIVVKGTVHVDNGLQEEIEILLQSQYPYCSPLVFCRNPRLKDSLHYDPATGQICVHFEDLDPWQPDMHYAVNYVEHVRDWFLSEKRGFTESVTDVPEPFDFRRLPAEWLSNLVQALVVPEALFSLPLGFEQGRLSGYLNLEKRMILLTSLHDKHSGLSISTDVNSLDLTFAGVEPSLAHCKPIRGYWLSVATVPPRSRKDILSYAFEQVRKAGIPFTTLAFDYGEKLQDGWYFLLGITYAYRAERQWVFLLLKYASKSSAKREQQPTDVWFVPTYGIRPYRDLFLRLEGVVDYELLAEKQVVVVGAGTLGSWLTLLLCQAGVERFVLYDNDRLEPGNVVRHVCDLGAVGKFKVEALKSSILHRNPLAKVIANPTTFDCGLENFISTARQSNLIINAIGSQNVARFLNSLAVKYIHRPTIHGWLTLGAVAGEVIRVVPGRSACVECFLKHPGEIGHDLSLPSVDIGRTSRLFPAGCAFPALPGAMVDISFFPSFMARLAIQTLLEGNESTTYLSRDGDYVFWTNRVIPGSTIEPLKCHNRSYRPAESCKVCGTRSSL